MSLVDYAASSDEDEPQIPATDEEENEQVKENPDKRPRFEAPAPAPAPSTSSPPTHHPINAHHHHRISTSLRPPPSKLVPDQSPPLKLPDASFLLNSPAVPSQLNASDHSSRVAAAMAESAARKRDLNGSAASYPRSKVSKGALPNTKSVPETGGGHLLPPQLSGRSNVVTEDISKLFVRKHSDSATE